MVNSVLGSQSFYFSKTYDLTNSVQRLFAQGRGIVPHATLQLLNVRALCTLTAAKCCNPAVADSHAN